MASERRKEPRASRRDVISVSWTDDSGTTQSADVRSLNTSSEGIAFVSATDLAAGTAVYVAAHDGLAAFHGVVRHCVPEGDSYIVGLELQDPRDLSNKAALPEDYYEFLQISPGAQPGTIHRVFRYLAGLYHPDNPETGDAERFLQLNRAYSVLSDPGRRAAYDAELIARNDEPSPAFAGIDFMDGIEGELNRRLAVLAVLYRKCRSNIHEARVKLVELERQIGFPRDYLDFTTWYLRSKKYITKEDNSDFALTAAGVDFVEENHARIPLLRRLVTSGTVPSFRGRFDQKSSASSSPRPTLVLPDTEERASATLLPDKLSE